MWKFGDWTKRTKWIVTGIIALIIALGFIGAYNSTPTITINNARDSKISTDNTEYEFTGDVSSMKSATLTINDEFVPLSSGSKFSHKVSLEEGDNDFNLVAANDNGETSETVAIHRTTQAEFAARAEAERLAAEKKAGELRTEEEKKAQEKAEEEARVAKEKAEADAKAAAKAKAQAEAQAQHKAHIDGLATTYCSNHQGNRNIYIPQASSRDAWENPNKDLLTKYPKHSNCVTIMTFFVDTMPSDYIDNIISFRVGTGMNKAEVLAAWGWPNNNSNHSSDWGSSGTWTWDTGTCYYGVCPHQQYVTLVNGKVDSTGNY